MERIVSRLVRTGVDPGADFHQRRKVILLNAMCLVGILAYLVIFFINLLKGSNKVFLIPNLSAQAVFLLTLTLNRAGWHRTAALFCCSVFLIYFNSIAIL